MRIFAIDAETCFASLLQLAGAAHGHEVAWSQALDFAQIEVFRPDIVLIEPRLSGGQSGVEAAYSIMASTAAPLPLAFASAAWTPLAVAAVLPFKSRVIFDKRDDTAGNLLTALATTHSAYSSLSVRAMISELTQMIEDGLTLDKREAVVLLSLIHYKTEVQIARELGTSQATVSRIASEIRDKMKLPKGTPREVVVLTAQRLGLDLFAERKARAA